MSGRLEGWAAHDAILRGSLKHAMQEHRGARTSSRTNSFGGDDVPLKHPAFLSAPAARSDPPSYGTRARQIP